MDRLSSLQVNCFYNEEARIYTENNTNLYIKCNVKHIYFVFSSKQYIGSYTLL
jgi:hypothetical protein